MHSFLHNLAYMALGGFITSLVEYIRKYNLIDVTLDQLKRLYNYLKNKIVNIFSKKVA